MPLLSTLYTAGMFEATAEIRARNGTERNGTERKGKERKGKDIGVNIRGRRKKINSH